MIKIVDAIFEKIGNFIFIFLCEHCQFRGSGKIKKPVLDIYKRTLDIEFERDRSIGLGSTNGDGQTDRQTHTRRRTDRQTHTPTDIFLKHIFRLWE